MVARLSADGETLGLEAKTTFREEEEGTCEWQEWLTFIVKYRDLPASSRLSFAIFSIRVGEEPQLVGSAAMKLFNKRGKLKTGRQKLQVVEGLAVDDINNLPPPSKVPLHARSHLGQVDHLVKLYHRGDIRPLDWLDQLTFKEVLSLENQDEGCRAGDTLQLVVDLPAFPHAVLYQQPSYSAVAASAGRPTGARERPVGVLRDWDCVTPLLDTQVGSDNPSEMKAQKLARSLTRGIIDRDLKPNSEERNRLASITRYPPNKPLHPDEKALLWRFRYSLTKDPRALTKFLKSVDWGDMAEANEVSQLMQLWAPIEVADALELLSPDFKNEEVRSHAVGVFHSKDDEELLSYLLQLVQALRYESSDLSNLARFLIARSTRNPAFATFFHWYLFTEWEDPTFGSRASTVHAAFVSELQTSPWGDQVWEAIRRQTDMWSQLSYMVKELKSSRLKAARATERLREMLSEGGPCEEMTSMRVPLPLDPNIMMEGLVPQECSCFKSAQLPLRLSYRVHPVPISWEAGLGPLQRLHHDGHSQGGQLGEQGSIRTHVAGPGPGPEVGPSTISTAPRRPGVPPVLSGPGLVRQGDLLRCVMIFKKGDDLRQDQFILQMISLMDRLLKRENLDLRMTPYKVLPTSSEDGLVEFVPSLPLSLVISEHRTVHRYLAQFPSNTDATGPFGLKADVLETFIRSCAGYCVMTYILGVGDRHLDNLMITPDGRLFHIDFGYILGNDPKPFPPPMKVCREMVEAMGGQDSSYYVQFKTYSCEAYNILRKSAELILSLFHLMAGANIEAIRTDPEKAVLKLQEKFRLDFDDEQAIDWMQQLLTESTTALMPQLVEQTHKWAQYWR